MRVVKESQALFRKAQQLFPGGVNSPVRAFRSVGGDPVFIEKGNGAVITDADGNEYIDYCCSWGPLILGHANGGVLSAVNTTMQRGTSFGAPTRLENELAELILSNNRYMEKIRFVSSGTEAVMSAIRLARGFTGRKKIVKFEGCYHGHADALLVKAGSGLVTLGNSSSAGIPEAFVKETITVPLNEEDAVKKAFAEHGSDIAAVIIEPVPANNGLLLQRREFLQRLRDLCSAHGAVLIFDEVISGFRVGFGGAAAHYNIQPDLITYGKIIGGGFPVGAYGGRAEIMKHISPEGDVYQAGTLSGNPVAMAAGIAQLTQCLREGFYGDLERKTERLANGIADAGKKKGLKVFRIASIFWLAFTQRVEIHSAAEIETDSMKQFRALYHHLLDEGVYLGPSGYEVGFVSDAHTDEQIEQTIAAFSRAIDKLN